MKTIGFTFNDLDFVIHPFQFASMDGVLKQLLELLALLFCTDFYKFLSSRYLEPLKTSLFSLAALRQLLLWILAIIQLNAATI